MKMWSNRALDEQCSDKNKSSGSFLDNADGNTKPMQWSHTVSEDLMSNLICLAATALPLRLALSPQSRR